MCSWRSSFLDYGKGRLGVRLWYVRYPPLQSTAPWHGLIEGPQLFAIFLRLLDLIQPDSRRSALGSKELEKATKLMARSAVSLRVLAEDTSGVIDEDYGISVLCIVSCCPLYLF